MSTSRPRVSAGGTVSKFPPAQLGHATAAWAQASLERKRKPNNNYVAANPGPAAGSRAQIKLLFHGKFEGAGIARRWSWRRGGIPGVIYDDDDNNMVHPWNEGGGGGGDLPRDGATDDECSLLYDGVPRGRCWKTVSGGLIHLEV